MRKSFLILDIETIPDLELPVPGAADPERLPGPPHHRVVALGVPDRIMDQAPRAEQLQRYGLTAEGIARRIAALRHEESFETS